MARRRFLAQLFGLPFLSLAATRLRRDERFGPPARLFVNRRQIL